MRTFSQMNKSNNDSCLICKTQDDGEVVLVGIAGTESDGYPTRKCINFIRKYRFGTDGAVPISLENVEALLDCIQDNCRWPDFSIHYELGLDSLERNFVVKFYYSTGGWSGHEELIRELRQTWFWAFCWEQSRRGGHYIFEIDPNQFGQNKSKNDDRPNE